MSEKQPQQSIGCNCAIDAEQLAWLKAAIAKEEEKFVDFKKYVEEMLADDANAAPAGRARRPPTIPPSIPAERRQPAADAQKKGSPCMTAKPKIHPHVLAFVNWRNARNLRLTQMSKEERLKALQPKPTNNRVRQQNLFAQPKKYRGNP